MKTLYNYTQGKELPEKPLLDDDYYGKSILVNVNPCTDCLIINKERQTAFFPVRIAKTGEGFWFIGGVWKARLSARENMAGVFERETSLKISPEKFQRVPFADEDGLAPRTLWPTGRNDMHFFFSIELNDEEIQQVAQNLDAKEYDTKAGLQEFSYEDLKSAGVRDIVLDCFRLAVEK